MMALWCWRLFQEGVPASDVSLDEERVTSHNRKVLSSLAVANKLGVRGDQHT